MLEVALELLWEVIKIPYRPIRYLSSKKYRRSVYKDNRGEKAKICLYVFEQAILVLMGIAGIAFLIWMIISF